MEKLGYYSVSDHLETIAADYMEKDFLLLYK